MLFFAASKVYQYLMMALFCGSHLTYIGFQSRFRAIVIRRTIKKKADSENTFQHTGEVALKRGSHSLKSPQR